MATQALKTNSTWSGMFGIDRSVSTKRNIPAFDFFYNIETSVGLGQPNHRASVLLSQYMLDLFLSKYGEQLDLPRLEVTGTMDPETDRAIRAFQIWLEFSPHAGNVPVDGVLAPVACASVDGPNGRYVPPVLLLNRLWASINPQTFTDPYRLSAILGEEIAAELWDSHPCRQKRTEFQTTESFL
jgi:peptidoglycan hydrolase-like protein with peptidoglycan-binding domain